MIKAGICDDKCHKRVRHFVLTHHDTWNSDGTRDDSFLHGPKEIHFEVFEHFHF